MQDKEKTQKEQNKMSIQTVKGDPWETNSFPRGKKGASQTPKVRFKAENMTFGEQI